MKRQTTGFKPLYSSEASDVYRDRFRPLHDRVLIKVLDSEAKTAGGIIIPDTAKEKPQEGEVVAVGPGKRQENGDTQPVDLNVGDTVVFWKYSSNTVKIGDEELLILNESEIFGVIEKTKKKKK